MNEDRQTADGAPWIHSQKRRAWVRRTITVDRDLDQKLVARMRAEGIPVSRLIDKAIRVLLGERVA